MRSSPQSLVVLPTDQPQLSWDNMWSTCPQTRRISSRSSLCSPSRASPRLPPGVVSAALRKLPQAASRSSLRSPSQASPRLPPGSSCLAGLWGNRGRSPYRMCRSLSRIFMQIFHSFSSRAVGALFVATSLRHFAPVPPGVVSAASARLPQVSLQESSDSVFFCETSAGLGRTVGK